jgi:quinol monooxygenase YgiN
LKLLTPHQNRGRTELFLAFEAAGAAALGDVLVFRARNPATLRSMPIVSTRDRRLFCIHPRCTDETAFETHAELPHIVRCLERAQPLIDLPLDVTRASGITFRLTESR